MRDTISWGSEDRDGGEGVRRRRWRFLAFLARRRAPGCAVQKTFKLIPAGFLQWWRPMLCNIRWDPRPCVLLQKYARTYTSHFSSTQLVNMYSLQQKFRIIETADKIREGKCIIYLVWIIFRVIFENWWERIWLVLRLTKGLQNFDNLCFVSWMNLSYFTFCPNLNIFLPIINLEKTY